MRTDVRNINRRSTCFGRWPTMPKNVLVLWTESDWRCELHLGGAPGVGRLLVYRGEIIVTAESVPIGADAYARAELLWQMIR
jgi:hypothetical protein